jgi:molybdate-binding protein
MNTKEYLQNLKSGVQMKFSDFLDLIEQEYTLLIQKEKIKDQQKFFVLD